MKKLEGKLLSKKYFPLIIDEDCDVFYLDKGKKITLARFRKKVIPLRLCQIALEELELKYEVNKIDLSKGSQREDWFLKFC